MRRTLWCVDAHRLGTVLRTVRRRSGRRQGDVARVAGGSDATVSRIERGLIESVDVGTVVRVAAALEVRVDLVARWGGAELDRLFNARHAAMHDAVVPFLRRLGWSVQPEVSFSIYGERGVIDILALHEPSASILVVELKTEIVDVNALMGSVDRYRRLAPRIAVERGWPRSDASVWVALLDGRTNRRRLAAHASVLRAAYPDDGRRVRAWLAHPVGRLSALSFLPDRLGVTLRRHPSGATRVRLPRSRSAGPAHPATSTPRDGSAG